jgi:branched-chain amino acid transport system substrate-binding protein
MPYSGPLSAYALIGRTQDAFFKKLNAEGGINGRKIKFISYDDSFSPARTVEQARKLVESDEVLLIFQSLGTPTNNAIQKYLNEKNVPQLFVATGATKFGDPKNFPWTMGWQPTYQTEGRIYAKYILGAPRWRFRCEAVCDGGHGDRPHDGAAIGRMSVDQRRRLHLALRILPSDDLD